MGIDSACALAAIRTRQQLKPQSGLVQDSGMEAAMSANEIWQEVQCAQGDHDRFGDDLLVLGQRFHCHLCGSEHVASSESVVTLIELDGVMSYPDLPDTAEQLEALKTSAAL